MSFRKACEIFIPIDELLKAKSDSEKQADAKKNKTSKTTNSQSNKKLVRITEISKQIVQDGADVDGWMHFAAFMNEIYRKENDFNPQLYGAQSGRVIPFFASLKEKGKLVFDLQKIGNVDKIRINK